MNRDELVETISRIIYETPPIPRTERAAAVLRGILPFIEADLRTLAAIADEVAKENREAIGNKYKEAVGEGFSSFAARLRQAVAEVVEHAELEG